MINASSVITFNIYHEHINIRRITSTTSNQVHSTPKFMWKPKREKTMECFLIYIKNTFIEAPTSKFSSTNPLIYKHQLPEFFGTNQKDVVTPWFTSTNSMSSPGGYGPLIYRNQPQGISNSMSSSEPTGRRLQPPFFVPSYLLEI